MTKLSIDEINTLLTYNPDTGVFRWKRRPIDSFPNVRMANTWNSRYAGMIAGGLRKSGHLSICLNYKQHYAHHLAWLMMTGEWPSQEIDHRDLNPSNNKWINLRLATSSQNKHNQGRSISNTSGFKNITWATREKKWRAVIGLHRKQIHIGYYESKREAYAAYCAAAIKYHGEFARVA